MTLLYSYSHYRDIRYTKHPTLPPPPWLIKNPTPVGRHWGQSLHSIDDLKINILALIQRDPQEDYTTLYREHRVPMDPWQLSRELLGRF